MSPAQTSSSLHSSQLRPFSVSVLQLFHGPGVLGTHGQRRCEQLPQIDTSCKLQGHYMAQLSSRCGLGELLRSLCHSKSTDGKGTHESGKAVLIRRRATICAPLAPRRPRIARHRDCTVVDSYARAPERSTLTGGATRVRRKVRYALRLSRLPCSTPGYRTRTTTRLLALTPTEISAFPSSRVEGLSSNEWVAIDFCLRPLIQIPSRPSAPYPR